MNATDVRRLKMLLLWGAVKKRALAKPKVLLLTWGIQKNLCVWVQKNEAAWKRCKQRGQRARLELSCRRKKLPERVEEV